MKKFGFRLIFDFSVYPNFKWLLPKIFSRVLSNFYYVTNIFDLHIFDNETAAFLFIYLFIYLFEICPDMYFVSLFFLNERNITTSLLTTKLKCTVVHYANLNSSFKSKPFLNYVPLNILFFFFFLFLMFILMKLLVQKMYEITIIF